MGYRRITMVGESHYDVTLWHYGAWVLEHSLRVRSDGFVHEETISLEDVPGFLRRWADEVEKTLEEKKTKGVRRWP